MTFNQLTNWRKTSVHWRMMDNTPERKKQKYIRFKTENWEHEIPYVNIIWYYIGREFKQKFKEIKVYSHFHLFNGLPLHGDDKYDKPAVYVHTVYNEFDTRDWEIQYTLYFGANTYYESFVPRKNMELNNDSICKSAIADAQKKYLFPKGRFRDFQESQNATKEYTKKIYRMTIGYKPEAYDESDIDKWVRKHYNLDISAMDTIFANDIVHKYGKQKELKVVLPFPQDEIYDAMYEIDGDIDEHEAAWWSVINGYDKNVLFF
jgi:hypothetical protein